MLECLEKEAREAKKGLWADPAAGDALGVAEEAGETPLSLNLLESWWTLSTTC